MDKQEFEKLVQRYKMDLMKTAERGGQAYEGETRMVSATPQQETIPQQIHQNPPEAGPGEDPLGTFSEEKVSYAAFLQQNPKTGILRVQVSSASRAIPIPGARVTVTREFIDGPRTFATVITDKNGIADDIVLPTPDKAKSQSPSSTEPYATYDITVSHPDYQGEHYSQVPVFEGIKSIQLVNFLPVHTDLS